MVNSRLNNKQEELWGGSFGSDYHERNPIAGSRVGYWRRVLRDCATHEVHTALEFGCGKGDNLIALGQIIPRCARYGVEINPGAAAYARSQGFYTITGSIFGEPPDIADLVITRGLLIHIHPDNIPRALGIIGNASKRYVVLAEYYAPTTREITYHDEIQACWADDYCGLFLKQCPEFKLLDYGFSYGGAGGDDTTFFLLERRR